MASSHPTSKFHSLTLDHPWENAAERIDLQLSDLSAGSYGKTALGATWRTLPPPTQRCYMLVAVKKSQREISTKGPRLPSTNEAYMTLIQALFGLLWVAPFARPEPSSRSAGKKKYKSVASVRVPVAVSLDSDGTTTMIRSRCLQLHLTTDPTSGSVNEFIRRTPTSPLARSLPLTMEYDVDEEDSRVLIIPKSVGCGHDSDTSSEW